MPKEQLKEQTRLNLILVRPGFEEALKNELSERFKLPATVICRAAVGVSENKKLPKLNDLIFARQYMPRALGQKNTSFKTALTFLCKRVDVLISRGNRQKGNWTIHAFAIDQDDALSVARKLGKHFLEHIRTNHPEFFKRYTPKDDFSKNPRAPNDFIMQIFCPDAEGLWFSLSRVDDDISLFEGGFRPMRRIAGAPSRSASKLEEALAFMGRYPNPGDTAVDLGAAPGGWSLVLARHGANVLAIDHAKLTIDPKLRIKGQITHEKANGLKFMPAEAVDWMVCDMVIGAQETLKILRKWLQAAATRQFVVNVKLPKDVPWMGVSLSIQLIESIDEYKIMARQLLHDRNEITLMGYKIV